jgi:hypothetical protein
VARPAAGGIPTSADPASKLAFTDASGAAAQRTPADRSSQTLLAQVVQAVGGLDALKRVRTFVAEADTTFQMDRGTLPSATKTYVGYPDRFRVEALVDGAGVVQVFSRGQAWVEDPGGVRDLPPSLRDEFAASLRRDMIHMLVEASEGRLTARTLPEETSEGRVYRALEISGPSFPTMRLLIDPQGLIARQSFSAPMPDGRTASVEETFSDYRVVDGIRMPFRAELRRDERVMLTRVLKNVSLNDPLDDRLFAHP